MDLLAENRTENIILWEKSCKRVLFSISVHWQLIISLWLKVLLNTWENWVYFVDKAEFYCNLLKRLSRFTTFSSAQVPARKLPAGSLCVVTPVALANTSSMLFQTARWHVKFRNRWRESIHWQEAYVYLYIDIECFKTRIILQSYF